jgi:heme exporter protein D
MPSNVQFVLLALGAFTVFIVAKAVGSVMHRRAMLRRLLAERTARTERTFAAELQADGVDEVIVQALYHGIQDTVRLYDGLQHFPVAAEDDLGEVYEFILSVYADYPDPPGLWGLAHDVAVASRRRFSYHYSAVEAELLRVRSVRDLALWVQRLPPVADDPALAPPTRADAS